MLNFLILDIFRMAAEFVKTEIASADVVMFSKDHCPFCTKAQNAMKGINVDYKLIELNGRSGKLFEYSVTSLLLT